MYLPSLIFNFHLPCWSNLLLFSKCLWQHQIFELLPSLFLCLTNPQLNAFIPCACLPPFSVQMLDFVTVLLINCNFKLSSASHNSLFWNKLAVIPEIHSINTVILSHTKIQQLLCSGKQRMHRPLVQTHSTHGPMIPQSHHPILWQLICIFLCFQYLECDIEYVTNYSGERKLLSPRKNQNAEN